MALQFALTLLELLLSLVGEQAPLGLATAQIQWRFFCCGHGNAGPFRGRVVPPSWPT